MASNARSMIKLQPIVPKSDVFVKGFYDAIKVEAAGVAERIKADFRSTVATWNRSVIFIDEGRWEGTAWTHVVFTDNLRYFWVNDGTQPHEISARNAPLLRFQRDYTAKSVPRVIGSRAGGKSGPWEKRISVWHPGNEARKFDEEIAKKNRRMLTYAIRRAMKEGAKQSGHYLK